MFGINYGSFALGNHWIAANHTIAWPLIKGEDHEPDR